MASERFDPFQPAPLGRTLDDTREKGRDMPATYAGPAPPLRPAKAQQDKVRPGLGLRLRVRWNALDLDAALAQGKDPESSKALALRAQQLADPERRAKIARSIDYVLDVAERSAAAQLYLTDVPTWTQGVEDHRALLVEVADRLEAEDSPPVKGLAMADLLVEDAGSPLYVHQPADRLRHAVEAILAALGR
jgi:hypothetical protein